MTHFPITRYRIKFKANQTFQLPVYAGSSLRGAFGHALKNICCLTAATNKGQCQCQPVETCLYRRIFDPAKQKLALQDRVQDVAPPFVIEAHSLPTHIESHHEYYFYMTLIGEFAHSQQMMIQLAWQRALAVGIGSQLSKGQAQSQFLSFELCDRPNMQSATSTQVNLQFLTHMRLQHHGEILTADHFSPILFCRALVRRYLSLLEIYSPHRMNEQAIKQLFDDVHLVQGEHDFDWIKWSRWSNRQKQRMAMDGLLGEVKLTQLSEPLAELIYLGQWLHVGKGSVFGLGQYSLISTH